MSEKNFLVNECKMKNNSYNGGNVKFFSKGVCKMKIGLIGLGKMGYNLSLNLMDNHHEVVAYDVNKKAVEKLSNEGATGAFTVEELVNELPLSPKVVWIMVPAGEVTENVITELKELLSQKEILPNRWRKL